MATQSNSEENMKAQLNQVDNIGETADEVINLRCDACGEMNRDIGYNPEYKTSFWCGSCGQPNDIKIKYYSVIQTKDDYKGTDLITVDLQSQDKGYAKSPQAAPTTNKEG